MASMNVTEMLEIGDFKIQDIPGSAPKGQIAPPTYPNASTALYHVGDN